MPPKRKSRQAAEVLDQIDEEIEESLLMEANNNTEMEGSGEDVIITATLLAISAEIRQENLSKTNLSTSELLATENRQSKKKPKKGYFNYRLLVI